MKRILRLTSLLLVLTTLFASVFVFSTNAEAEEAVSMQKRTQKIVTVVYDDSGSMLTKIDRSSEATRADYALYAIKMLMSLLGEGDILQIVPMNKAARSYTLVGDKRQDQINEIVSSGIFKPNGSTPISSVDTALTQLVSEGLKDADNLTMQDENKDFWLFILTDGEFSGNNGATIKKDKAPEEMRKRIDKYPSLKTIYFAFSDAAIDLRNTSFETELSVAYKAGNGNELVKGMQEIASQLSGRYNYTDFSINGDKNAANGDSVVIDFSNSKFPIKNLSVLALNCDATITSAEYKHKDGTSKSIQDSINQTCVIKPDNIPGIAPGYSAVINGAPSFSNGILTIKFSKPVAKEYLSIFAEPALVLSPTFKVEDGNGGLRTVDSDYITGGKVYKGQKIVVGYKCTTSDGVEIDLPSAFGSEVKASVTYAGSTKQIPKGSKETDIILVEGPNSITVTVNIEGVNYKMYTSVNCNILADQNTYRVEAEHDTDKFSKAGKSIASYKVYVNNVEKTPAQLKSEGFSWYVEITSPTGDVKRIDNPEKNGKIECDVESKTGAFGNYKVYFRVISTLGWRMDEVDYFYSANMDDLEIRCDSPEIQDKGKIQADVDFTVHNGGEQLDKTALGNYDIKIKVTSYDGSEYETEPVVAENGKITGKVKLDPNVYGEYKACLFLSLKSGGLEKNHTHTFKIYPQSVIITGDHPDSFKSGETKATAKYWIKLDGKQIAKEQLDKYAWTLKTYAPDGVSEYGSTVTVDADGTIKLEYDVAGAPYGAYDTVLEIAFSDTYKENYRNSVKNYPTSVKLNVLGDKNITVTQHQLAEKSKELSFELFAGDLPLIFTNSVIDFKVLVDGKDVTQYAQTDGNVLKYSPGADHFGGGLAFGDYDVEVIVESPHINSVSASASFEVTKTSYEIKTLSSSKKRIERFRLKNLDSALHFQILRDGVPIPLDELEASYDSGAINVSDEKGTFSWAFWLPCGKEISAKEVDGQPVIEFRATRDIGILGLDKVMAMFFLTGDKPISISYQDAEFTDFIRIERGAVWIYLLIWFIIFLITHIILFIIGFFNGKCKNIPSGVFISVATTGKDGKEQDFTVDKKVNMTFSDKWSWHLGRLFLYGCFARRKLWYDQPAVKYGAYMVTLGYEDGELALVFKNEGMYKADISVNRTRARASFIDYKDKLASYNGKGTMPIMDNNLTVRELKELFKPRLSEAAIEPNQIISRYDGPCAEIGGKSHKVLSVMLFVEKTKK